MSTEEQKNWDDLQTSFSNFILAMVLLPFLFGCLCGSTAVWWVLR